MHWDFGRGKEVCNQSWPRDNTETVSLECCRNTNSNLYSFIRKQQNINVYTSIFPASSFCWEAVGFLTYSGLDVALDVLYQVRGHPLVSQLGKALPAPFCSVHIITYGRGCCTSVPRSAQVYIKVFLIMFRFFKKQITSFTAPQAHQSLKLKVLSSTVRELPSSVALIWLLIIKKPLKSLI